MMTIANPEHNVTGQNVTRKKKAPGQNATQNVTQEINGRTECHW